MSKVEVMRKFGEEMQAALSRLGDFLARLTFMRFVGLAILILIAASLTENLFDHKPTRPVIHISNMDREVTPPAPPPPPVAAVPGVAPADDPNEHGKVTARRRVEINIGDNGVVVSKDEPLPADDGTDAAPAGTNAEGAAAKESGKFNIAINEDGLTIHGDATDADVKALTQALKQSNQHALEKQIEDRIDAALDDARNDAQVSVSLPRLAVLLIVLLLIVRFVAQSRAKAEARAVSAESAADAAALQRQLAEARLQAMQAQVEPHFLFNTLAAVEHLIETDPPRAAGMQRNLIAYLRSVLPNLRQSESTLGREADISRNYLEILKVRMESRLDFQIDIPSGMESASMPPLMLQSLVENAIEHGLEPKPEGGSIHIAAAIRDGMVVITVADTGIGLAADAEARRAPRKGSRGVGLTSIRERLGALFDGRGRLVIEPNQPCGTRAILEFPYVFKSPSADR